jgi:kojibiose phosphorylase
VLKQADVVLLLYLLWDRFPPEVRAANFGFYAPRTAQDSSLSPAIHALVAARLGDLALADRYFRETAEIDLGKTMGNAAGGVHLAALGGLWQATVFGFAGMRLRSSGDGLAFDPHLPAAWQVLRFSLRWREGLVRVVLQAAPQLLEVELASGESITVSVVGGPEVMIGPGCRYRITRGGQGSDRWQEVRAA